LIRSKPPPGRFRPGEPGDPAGLAGVARRSLEEVARGQSHVVEVRADARRDRSGAHAVDEVDDRNVPVRVGGDEIVQTACGDGAENHRLTAAAGTLGELRTLRLPIVAVRS